MHGKLSCQNHTGSAGEKKSWPRRCHQPQCKSLESSLTQSWDCNSSCKGPLLGLKFPSFCRMSSENLGTHQDQNDQQSSELSCIPASSPLKKIPHVTGCCKNWLIPVEKQKGCLACHWHIHQMLTAIIMSSYLRDAEMKGRAGRRFISHTSIVSFQRL